MYLNCKTYYSFKYGTFSTDELVKTAADKGVTSLALTNINTTCGAWEFVKACRENKLKPILGAEIRKADKLLYILIAANNHGFSWINKFLSEHLIGKKDFPEPSVDLAFFENGWDGFVIYPFGAKPYRDLRLNERIGIQATEINKLFGTDCHDFEDKLIIRQPVTVQNKIFHNLHRLLREIHSIPPGLRAFCLRARRHPSTLF